MSILYSARVVKSFQDDVIRYTLTPKAVGTVTINELADDMAAESTVTRHDVKAVLSSLEVNIIKSLRRGNTVQLGDLGSFHLTFKSGLVTSKEEVSPSLVKNINVRFVPSKAFKNAMKKDNEFISFKAYHTGTEEKTPAEGETENV